MKKLICVLLALVLALAPVTTFAYAPVKNYDTTPKATTTKTESSMADAVKKEKEERKSGKEDKEEKPSAKQGIKVEDWYEYNMPYVIKVDRVNQLISIYEESSSGNYDVLAKRFICSTGTKSNPTPKGMFTLSDAERREWRYFKTYRTYVRYGVHIEGNYFFHSLLYSRPDTSTLSRTSYKKIGSPASHGCIRMLDNDIKWMFEHCLAGTRVYVMDCKKDSDLHDEYMPEDLK